MINRAHTKNTTNSQAGFSLVEFIVILTLFAIMASVVTFDFQKFRTSIDRSNLASDIALSYRQMQVFGISSSNRVIGEPNFETNDEVVAGIVANDLAQESSIYAVEIDFDEQTIKLYQEFYYESFSGDPDQYDQQSDRLVDLLQISGSDNRILRVCLGDSGQQPSIDAIDGSCVFDTGSSGEDVGQGTFNTSFKRPFPDAKFHAESISDPSFEPQIALLAIGPSSAAPQELRYVHLDAVGLVQVVKPEFSE